MVLSLSTARQLSIAPGEAAGLTKCGAASSSSSARARKGPWQNACVESVGSRVRDELLAVEMFSCLAEARVLVEDWRQDYNRHRPHSSLGMMAPVLFSIGWQTARGRARQRRTALALGLAAFDAGADPTLDLPTNHQLSQQVDR
jgi:hypothetical protein